MWAEGKKQQCAELLKWFIDDKNAIFPSDPFGSTFFEESLETLRTWLSDINSDKEIPTFVEADKQSEDDGPQSPEPIPETLAVQPNQSALGVAGELLEDGKPQLPENPPETVSTKTGSDDKSNQPDLGKKDEPSQSESDSDASFDEPNPAIILDSLKSSLVAFLDNFNDLSKAAELLPQIFEQYHHLRYSDLPRRQECFQKRYEYIKGFMHLPPIMRNSHLSFAVESSPVSLKENLENFDKHNNHNPMAEVKTYLGSLPHAKNLTNSAQTVINRYLSFVTKLSPSSLYNELYNLEQTYSLIKAKISVPAAAIFLKAALDHLIPLFNGLVANSFVPAEQYSPTLFSTTPDNPQQTLNQIQSLGMQMFKDLLGETNPRYQQLQQWTIDNAGFLFPSENYTEQSYSQATEMLTEWLACIDESKPIPEPVPNENTDTPRSTTNATN